jgi:hypothetical protein
LTARIINLTRARKSRARVQERLKADANAAKFGRTKAEREAATHAAETAARHLDQHRLEKDRE